MAWSLVIRVELNFRFDYIPPLTNYRATMTQRKWSQNVHALKINPVHLSTQHTTGPVRCCRRGL